MPDGIHARPLGFAITAIIAMTLCGCTAASPSPSPVDVSLPGSPTLRSIIEAGAEHPDFELVQETTDFDGDHAEIVSYESGGLRVQAVIRRPASGAPNGPAIVLIHGSADPDDYSGLTYYDPFADDMVARGYTVVMPDLRNHADSDDAADWDTDMQIGETLDAINAVRATASDPAIDPERVALIGHSSGGRITVNAAVTAPDIAAAFIAVAPSNASAWRNVERFAGGTPYFDTIVAAHGSPEQSPEFWADVSSSTFIDRATTPLLLIHGTADEVVPYDWSQDLVAAWQDAGKEIELVPVTGGDHLLNDRVHADELWDTIADHLAREMP